MSVKLDSDSILYYCHHCNEKGKINRMASVAPTSFKQSKEIISSIIKPIDEGLSQQANEYLNKRGITNTDGLVSGVRYFSKASTNMRAVGFPVYVKDKLYSIKWRSIEDKYFQQEGPTNRMFLIDKHMQGEDLVITEGEIDAISFRECGYHACSVPNGAPGMGANLDGDDFLWTHREEIKKAKRIFIATDADEPGQHLADELSRRIGKYKCWRIVWPEGMKDGNDVLVNHGKDGLTKLVEESQPWPIDGLHNASEYRQSVIKLHAKGFPSGKPVGVLGIDNLFKMAPSTLTLITGTPGSGKSTFLNFIMATLAIKHGKKFALWSAEMSPEITISNLCALYHDKPFRGLGGQSPEEFEEAFDWVDKHFVIIESADNSIDAICEAAKAAVLRNGIDGLIVDPYNFISVSGSYSSSDEHTLSKARSVLTSLKNLSMSYGLHCILCAHPRKMQSVNGITQIPEGYDVSGSADFFNIPDIGITISQDENRNSVLTNWKTRFPHLGKIGSSTLNFNPATGVFSDIGQPAVMYPNPVQPSSKTISQTNPFDWIK